jgi:flagellar motor switch protein FliN
MSSGSRHQLPLDAQPRFKEVIDAWADGLAQALESMADQRPEISWRSATGPIEEIGGSAGPGAESEILWWEQPFQRMPSAAVWIGTPKAAWEYLGSLTLRAAGLETIEPSEARSTWFEILGQSLSLMARAIGAKVGREINCEAGVERLPDAETRQWGLLTLSLPEAALAPLIFTISPKLQDLIAKEPEPQADSPVPAVQEPEPEPPAETSIRANPRTMELLLDVDLPVSISFGKAQLALKDVLKLTTGSIVELNRGANDHVEVMVNHCLIARGEVVVVEGNYGVRIQEIASRQDRLRSLA